MELRHPYNRPPAIVDFDHLLVRQDLVMVQQDRGSCKQIDMLISNTELLSNHVCNQFFYVACVVMRHTDDDEPSNHWLDVC